MVNKPLWLVVRVAILTLFAATLAPNISKAAPADMLIDNIDFVDVEQRRIIRNGQILIDDGRIVYAGERQTPAPEALETMDGSGLIALPGFVNAHTHLWQHVSRGLQPGGDLQSWAAIIHQFLHYST